MELKDVILSTLAEMEEVSSHAKKEPISKENFLKKEPSEQEQIMTDEMLFLSSLRERLLVLFEGFQAPNNKNIEAKVDLTLNFLEYVLATIESRIEKIEKRN